MGMQYRFIEGEYKYWNDSISIPTKRRKADGSIVYFKKKQEWDEVKSYWAYRKAGDCYELYRRYNTDNNSRLVETNMHLSPDTVLYRICSKFYKVSDCDKAEAHHSPVGERTPIATVYWSKELDGKSFMILLMRYPKMTSREIMMVLENEGATVDAQGIIHAKQ